MELSMEKSVDVEASVEDVYKEFMTMNKAKDLAESTMSNYKWMLKWFLEWLDDQGIETCIEIKQNDIYKFINHLKEDKDLANRSINSYLTSVRTFLNFAREAGYAGKLKIRMLKEQEKSIKTYTEEELNRLLKKPDIKECSFAKFRNWAVCNYLLATGNRLSTVINLKIKDLDFKNRMLHLNTTKNNKAQIVPMSNKLARVLREYLSYRDGTDEDWVFPSIQGKKFSVSGFQKAIIRYHKSRGVEKTSIHLYRHTFAKMAVKNGIDPLRLQKLLGHASLDMTRRYVNLFGTDLQEGFNDYNPLEQL